jgi:predicted nucleic acid-binding protein
MISYFDTSVLFPALHIAHPDHLKYKRVFNKAIAAGEIVCLSTHVYAELFANLTRFPRGRRIHPKEAVVSLTKLTEAVRVVDLGRKDYEAALHRCAQLELISGIIYDALHLQAAVKAEADAFYTSNLRDFQRLWTQDIPFELIGV